MRKASLAVHALALAVLALPLGACFLPVGTAAPQSATTIGKGSYATSFHAELPTINLIAEDEEQQGQDGDHLVAAPSASMTFGVQYGLTDRLDLELGIEGEMFLFLIPIPLGFSGGFRYQVVETPSLDVAIAARAGYVGLSGSSSDSSGTDEWSANAKFGQFTGVAQLARGPVRPLLALSLMPTMVYSDLPDQTAESFTGLATTATLGLAIVAGDFQLTPFGAFTYFSSTEIDGVGTYSVGVSFALRPDKTRFRARE